MKIDRIAATKVRVQLNERDMKTLNLSYSAITWESQNSRDMIEGLLTVVNRETGFRRHGKKMLIEVFEPRRGECCFVFTLLPRAETEKEKRRFRVIRPSAPILFQFDGNRPLLSAMEAIARQGIRRHSRCKLFKLEDDQYFLLIYPLQRPERHLEPILCEFGHKRRYTTYAAAALEERGVRIAEGDLLSKMTRGFECRRA